MFRLLLFIPIALLLVAFQASVLSTVTLAGGHLDILLILLVFLTMYGSLELGILSAVVLAPLVDALSGMPLGISIIPMLSVVFIAYGGNRIISGTRLGWPVVITFIGVLAAGLITMAELALLGWDEPWSDLILRTLLPTALINALAVLLIYLPISLIGERREMHVK